jgi:hypothetical protein
MDHEIFTWLNSDQDYPSGLLLYDRFCKNTNLGRILRIGGATGKNRLTLAYELGKVIKPQALQNFQKHSKPSLNQENPVPDKEIRIPASLIEDIRKERKMIYKVLDALHASLPFRDKDERRRIVFEILDLDDRLREIMTRIDHYEETGIILPMPDKQEKIKVRGKDTCELLKRMYTLRTYVTRYKNLLVESESLDDRDHYQKKLDEYQQELKEVNKKICQ